MHVVATAGHVDHGKSTLVRALTGMEPDRWAEERRRGMTIDLGFAWTTLPEGRVVAFVDVPGHQRFVPNMLAGVGPVAAVLFVVAADEGWRRQSTEHLDALDALGVRHGVLAVTRSDLADPGAALAQARERLAGTGLADIEAVAVSTVDGSGLDALRAALARLVDGLPAPRPGPVRLWIDRAFTIRGAGTVVTGTLGRGTVEVGDELLLLPADRPVRVRGLHSLNTPVPRAEAVARLAVNLRGVRLEDVHRGHSLVTPGAWTGVAVMDVRLLLPGADAAGAGPPERSRSGALAEASTGTAQRLPAQLVLHAGSAAVPVRLRPLGPDTARLSLATALPLHVGERALLRDPGEHRVAAGVLVLDTVPPPLGRRGAAARRAAELADLTGTPDPAGEVRRRGAVRRAQLTAAGILPPGVPPPDGARPVGDWLIDQSTWRDWAGALAAAADRWAAGHPMAPAVPREAAVREAGVPDPALLAPLVAQAGLVLDAAGVHRPGTVPTLPVGVSVALSTVVERLTREPFDAPDANELAALGLTAGHLATAVRLGALLAVGAGVYLLPTAPTEAARRVADLEQPFTLGQARQALGTTRRVAVPLFELLDRERVTRRLEDGRRVLHPDPAAGAVSANGRSPR